MIFARSFFPGLGDALQDFGEAGLPVAILRRKIGAAEERLQVGREPDAHRPAAAAGRRLHEGHVDAVDVGPLFAVDFDVDEMLVHHRGDGRDLEFFALHHVAPMAGGIADREKDRLVLLARFRERFLAPRIPVDGVVRVLEKVGRFLVDQAIRVLGMRGLDFGGGSRGGIHGGNISAIAAARLCSLLALAKLRRCNRTNGRRCVSPSRPARAARW